MGQQEHQRHHRNSCQTQHHQTKNDVVLNGKYGLQQIIQDIESTVAAIAAGAEYHNTVKKVVRYEDWDDDLREYPAAMILALDSSEDDIKFSGRQQCTMGFSVTMVLEGYQNAQRDASRIMDDVKKALLQDVQRSTLALDTEITRLQPFLYDGEEPRGGGVVFGKVKYRHMRSDPYTQG